MPNTRPDTAWQDGECSACISYKRRPTIDWDARKAELVKLLDRHDGRCIVPSSGGKDSTYQVLTLLEMGADVTVVTASTCHLTAMGRANIDNLARYARTIEVSPNKTVRAKLNRLGLEMVGDISWPEHCAIFTTPRWRSEFGGFLGLRPSDFEGMEGLTLDDLADYTMPLMVDSETEAHFLGQYLRWDSWLNAATSAAHGFKGDTPSEANWWWHENLDNAQTGLHDYFMFRKFGFGRGCQQISCDVRSGRVDRDTALRWVTIFDGIFPEVYAGVPVGEVLDRIGMTRARLDELVQRFSNAAV
jgi:hypothetical protein